MTDVPRRSAAAVQKLERMQAQAGELRDPSQDPQALREIAQKQILAEQTGSTLEELRNAMVRAVTDPGFEAAVERRVAQLAAHWGASDGDLWSQHERPDRRRTLSDLVVRIEAAALALGLALPRRPVVGTLPTRDLNAQALPGPPGEGHIIVFESGIFSYTSLLAKIAAWALNITFDGDSLHVLQPPEIPAHVATHPQILQMFADLAFSQAILGTSIYAVQFEVPPAHDRIAAHLSGCVNTFILAHEYAHVILGHTGVHAVGSAKHEQEYEADAMAFDITAEAWRQPWAHAAATLFLSGAAAIARANAVFITGTAEVPPSETHPPLSERQGRINARLRQTVEPQRAEVTMRLSGSMAWVIEALAGTTQPLFEKAYQQAYPPIGYRPASEIEKAAAFHSFLATGFGVGNQ
jgi:hypothetical protein